MSDTFHSLHFIIRVQSLNSGNSGDIIAFLYRTAVLMLQTEIPGSSHLLAERACIDWHSLY